MRDDRLAELYFEPEQCRRNARMNDIGRDCVDQSSADMISTPSVEVLKVSLVFHLTAYICLNVGSINVANKITARKWRWLETLRKTSHKAEKKHRTQTRFKSHAFTY